MLTGELRNKIDQLWNAFWSGGIANPLEVIKQITYLLFLRSLHQSGVPAAQSAFAHPMRDARFTIAVHRHPRSGAGRRICVGAGG